MYLLFCSLCYFYSTFLIDYTYIRIYIITICFYQSVADANGMLLTFAKLTLIIIIVAWSSFLLPMYFGNANLITSVAAQQNSEEEDLFFRGNNAYQQGRYEEAIEYFDRVLAIDPDHWEALNKNHMNALIHKGLALDRLER